MPCPVSRTHSSYYICFVSVVKLWDVGGSCDMELVDFCPCHFMKRYTRRFVSAAHITYRYIVPLVVDSASRFVVHVDVAALIY